ncbi:hypothetical protein [Actinopolymorpha alba]|uniref:hypothetical protein n=1 Tax=Actinopolymorpha alba TaxID=533267 RepID=UPI000381CFDE|nr:hypothetical protein [Actinopolymorpha alba]
MPRIRLALAFVAAGAIVLAGCSSDEPETTGAQQQTKDDVPAQVANEKPSEDKKKPTPAQLKSAVGKVVLGEGDIGHDVEVQDQDDTLEAATNDICAKDWSGDNSRIARNQDFFWKSARQAKLVVSNEAVAYQPGKGSAAIAELKQAAAECNTWKHDQGTMGKVHIVDPPKGALDGSFAWQGSDDRKGVEYSYVAVYQTKDDLLSALYVWAPSENEARDVAAELAPKAAQRLEKALG